MCRRGGYKSQNVIGFAGAFFTRIPTPLRPGVCRNKNDIKPRTMPIARRHNFTHLKFQKWSTLFLFISTWVHLVFITFAPSRQGCWEYWQAKNAGGGRSQ